MLALASVAFNVPWCIEEQIRLLRKNLRDDYELTVYDNSDDAEASDEIERICDDSETDYVRLWLPQRLHHYALNKAAIQLCERKPAYLGFIDHDIFPTKKTRLIPTLDRVGFYGMGQRHGPSDALYLWPGFCFYSADWLKGRVPDFFGIQAPRGRARDAGDTGSRSWRMFTPEDWRRLDEVGLLHSYQQIRDTDDAGLQSWAVERLGDWLHPMNAGRWKVVPFPEQRDQIVRDLVAAL